MENLVISVWSLAILVLVALAFDFMNGFHDGANSISTIVATGALTPKQAVLFAAFFNFAAIWVFHLQVAEGRPSDSRLRERFLFTTVRRSVSPTEPAGPRAGSREPRRPESDSGYPATTGETVWR